ncbi:aromatic acid exporter family protein [Sporolactobacillus kofuensis]|uniref:Aromatic acid exporter family protein n=1 Tax=Sporolactobacillus kofuensis TaxID=269672 RepID=A0ABW1WGY5_9BACL|nr:aromatic acid exporter family protein [Sporolactobacillus kofuensis]MCO7175293.1 aromatic acid exporter family protein [Sporolactobacillus kofuensis]
MHLGARSLKTGVAVTIALMTSIALGMTPPIMAGVAAAMTTRPSVQRSLRAMVQNIIGNFIGALIAVGVVIIFGDTPIVVGLAVVFVIALHLKFGLHRTLTLTMVTVIFIMSSGMQGNVQFLLEGVRRFSMICIGVVSATLVNLLIFPPHYEKTLYEQILAQTTQLFKWIRLLSGGASDNTKIKSEMDAFDRNKLKIENYYHWYKEERIFSRKSRLAKLRRTVIFREMITATRLLHQALNELDRNENTYRLLPDAFRETLRLQLSGLMTFHERVLLKFDGKIRRKRHEEQAKKDYKHRSEIADTFFSFFAENNTDDWLDVLPLISTIIDYSQHVEHLDLLVESYQSFHKKVNPIS